MKRALEIASGIGVLLTSLLNSAAVFKMIFYYQQTPQKVSLISVVSLTVTGAAVVLSYVGAYILLSWANKPKLTPHT